MTHYDFVIIHRNQDTRQELEGSLLCRPGRRWVRQGVDAGEAIKLIEQRVPDCLLLEIDPSDSRALDTLKNGMGQVPCPTVAVLEGTFARDAMEALRGGAQDYIFRQRISEPGLWQAVEYAKSRFQLQKQLDVDHRKLARLNDELRRKTDIKTTFMASATHDLRTPISAISGLVSLLRQRADDAETEEMLHSISSCCDALLFSVNDLLDLAEMQNGRLVLTENVFHPEGALRGVAETAQVWATGKRLSLRTEIAPDLPFVVGDERRTCQVLFNLINNAIKFTERGQVVLRASVDSCRDDQILIRYEVSDTGVGIAEKDRERVFDRHFQSGPWKERGEQGSGLGLWVVKQLALRLGATIGLASQPGRGSTFSFCVPYGTASSAVAEDTPSNTLAENPLEDHPARILVAEDNSVLARVLASQLEHLGFEVAVAKDGQEALEQLEKRPVDLAVFDARMPRMDGIAACKELRKSYAPTQLPVILLTADALVEERVWRRAGFSQLLVKPVEIGRLETVIRDLLGQPLAKGEADRAAPSERRAS